MGSGFKTFAAAEVLTAANVNNYLMEQSVMSFADATARDAAVTSPEEGMTAYLQDVNSVTVYSGSAWVTIADLEVLVVDSANGRVGINTDSPDVVLDIHGNGNALRLTGAGNVYQEFYANGTVAGRSGYVGYGNTADDDFRINNSITGGGIDFYTENAVRMTVDSSGKVGIGTTSPLGALDIHGNTESLIFSSPSNTNRYRIDANITDTDDFGLSIAYWDGSAYQRTLTVDDSGKVEIGDAAEGLSGSFRLGIIMTSTNAPAFLQKMQTAGSGNVTYQQFFRGTTTVGSIVTTTSSTSYNTSSDYRMKDVQGPLSGALGRLQQLNPVQFRWVNAPDEGDQEGFLAHEVGEVVPQAVSGEKDAVTEDGEIDPQQFDASKLVPMLVAAVQELSTTLTARIEALEAA